MIKLIAADIDGTLTDNEGRVTPLTVETIKEAQQNGLEFVICTGRNYYGLDHITAQNGFQCAVVSGNGGVLYDKYGKRLRCNPLTDEEKRIIIEIINEYRSVYFFFHQDDGFYSMSSKEELQKIFDDYAENLESINEVNRCKKFCEEFLDETHFSITAEEVMKHPFLKAEAIFINDNLYNELLKRITEVLDMNITTANIGENIELTNLNASKGKALSAYAKIMGIKENEVAVFGDSMNDASMFELFTESYAMANGEEELKKMAKYIADSNDEDGVAKAILKILENNKTE